MLHSKKMVLLALITFGAVAAFFQLPSRSTGRVTATIANTAALQIHDQREMQNVEIVVANNGESSARIVGVNAC